MTSAFYVQVPSDVAGRLVEDGFREAGAQRGIDALLGTSANLVTIAVGSHEISRFVRHLWDTTWRHKRTPQAESKVIIEHDGRRVTITLEHEGFGEDGPPETVLAGLSALLAVLAKPGWGDP